MANPYMTMKKDGELTIREMTDSEYNDYLGNAYKNKKQSYTQEVEKLRDHHIHKNIEYNNMLFNAHPQAIQNMIEAVSMDNAGLLSTPVTWTLADGSTADLSSDDIKSIAQLMQQRKTDAYANQRSLVASINSASTLDELKAIDLNAGWPS